LIIIWFFFWQLKRAITTKAKTTSSCFASQVGQENMGKKTNASASVGRALEKPPNRQNSVTFQVCVRVCIFMCVCAWHCQTQLQKKNNWSNVSNDFKLPQLKFVIQFVNLNVYFVYILCFLKLISAEFETRFKTHREKNARDFRSCLTAGFYCVWWFPAWVSPKRASLATWRNVSRRWKCLAVASTFGITLATVWPVQRPKKVNPWP